MVGLGVQPTAIIFYNLGGADKVKRNGRTYLAYGGRRSTSLQLSSSSYNQLLFHYLTPDSPRQ
jgi:hypothetical protein